MLPIKYVLQRLYYLISTLVQQPKTPKMSRRGLDKDQIQSRRGSNRDKSLNRRGSNKNDKNNQNLNKKKEKTAPNMQSVHEAYYFLMKTYVEDRKED